MRRKAKASEYEIYIRTRAHDYGYTLTGLAASLGMSVQTLYHKLSGQTHWRADELRMLALILDLSIAEVAVLGIYRVIPCTELSSESDADPV